MEGNPRISRIMSAGPGPPKSPAPHPPRRGHSVTAGRLPRYMSLREHKSVLDFGRDWRDWDVDVFRDDETMSNATTDTEMATSIGDCIGIAVDEEDDDAQMTQRRHQQQQQPQQQQQQHTPPSPTRRRSYTAPFQSAPQIQLDAQSPSQWEWPDLMAAISNVASSEGSPISRGNGAGLADGAGAGAGAANVVPAPPDSPVRFSYPNRRRPKTAPNAADSPLYGRFPCSFSPTHRPPSEPGSLFSLARTPSGSRSPATGVSSTKTPLNSLGLQPAPSAGSALLPPASAADAAPHNAPTPAPGGAPGTAPVAAPFPPDAQAPARDLRPPVPALRPRSHNPVLISSRSSCADVKLSARADHARSQIITKLASQPPPNDDVVRSAQWEYHLARGEEQHHPWHHRQTEAEEKEKEKEKEKEGEEDEEDRRRRKEQEEDDAAHWAQELTRLEEETDRILEEQKRKDLVRLQAQLAAVPDPPPRIRSPIVDKFTFFLRKSRKSDPASLAKSPSTYFQPLSAPDMDPSRFIQAGGGGIVPQTDAPTSASNAGERRVTVRCLQSSISLPVTPDTTPSEILYSSANLMTQDINPKTSVVVECYFAFGLERRLRRYERVRDVMNSWDRDTQHCLLIVPGDSVDKNVDLNLECVPRTLDPPTGFVNLALYHSQRPGKWSKRYINFLENGQVFAAKKKDAKLSDKDANSLCHISDFDLYSVTEKDILKQIKSPKKNCFAVKSQQKLSVFQNTENFVHFFATDDIRLAEDFQKVIHGWRSWYLANKKVDLTKNKKYHHSGSDHSASTIGIARSSPTHRLKASVDETPYTIGTFSPLLDMDRFEKPMDDFGQDSAAAARPADQLSVPKHKVVSRSRTAPNLPSSQPVAKKHIDLFGKDQEFRAGGLLGRAYEGRKQQAEKSVEEQQHHTPESPFTGGQSLLNKFSDPDRQLPERRGTVRASRSAAETTPQPRSRSRPPGLRHLLPSRPRTSDGPVQGKREMPQPLVDLTPRVPDLPAAWRDAQGRGIKAPNGTPLIQMATGWENQPDTVMGPQLPTVTRMGTAKAYPPQRMASQSATSRPRSRSSAGAAPVRRVVSNEQPPLPSVPKLSSKHDDEDVPLINFVERERGRDTRPGVSQGVGRSGTVRH
ncbi:hypothetical protein EsH8_III_000776 [Colletotrichum jinshuiense]